MKVAEITGNTRKADDAISILRRRTVPNPDMAKIEKSVNLKKHDVYDPNKRRDNTTYPNPKVDANGRIVDKGEPDIDKVNRIGLDLQELVVNRAVSFLFGNPVILKYDAKTDEQKRFIAAFQEVLHDNYEPALNRQAGRSTFTYTEAAEYWYTQESKDSFADYGFKTDRELKCVVFSPEKGDILYPNFDENGEMSFFSRSFIRMNGSLTTQYFETYTDEEIVKWKSNSLSAGWVEYSREEVTIGRNPINYVYQRKHESAEVDDLISRVEKSVSNVGDINDRHTAPKIFVNGKLISFGAKSQANTVLEGGPGTDAKYLSWNHAPESFKMEVDFLLRMIFTLTQTPDISFENMKGIGAISGVALKLLFMDAHLKVKDKEEIFIPYLRRRDKIITAYLCEMNNKWRTDGRVRIDREIDPFMIADDLTQAQILQIATGAKPFMSQQQSVKEWGSADAEMEVKQLNKEAMESSQRDLFEVTE